VGWGGERTLKVNKSSHLLLVHKSGLREGGNKMEVKISVIAEKEEESILVELVKNLSIMADIAVTEENGKIRADITPNPHSAPAFQDSPRKHHFERVAAIVSKLLL